MIAELLLSLAFAQTIPGSPGAEEVMQKSFESLYRSDDQRGTLTFTVINPSGVTKKTIMNLYWKNYRGRDGFLSKSLLITEFPTHLKGEGFLVWEHAGKEAPDLWLYLPELRQVRRVQPLPPDDPITGSDILFEEMRQNRPPPRGIVLEEEFRGVPCWVVETPGRSEGPYGKVRHWISKEDFMILQAEYFDKGDRIEKNQKTQWQKIGGFHVWKKTEMTNSRTGRRTIIEFSEVIVNGGLRDDLFTDRALRRGGK